MLNMGNENVIASVAMMQAIREKQQRDYLDILLPFVEKVLPGQGEIVSFYDISLKIEDEFSIKIPINVVEKMVSRLKRKKYIHKENKIIRRTDVQIDTMDFDQTRDKMLAKQKDVCQAFMDYYNRTFSGNVIDLIEAKQIVLRYLKKYTLEDTRYNEDVTLTGTDEYHVGRFIQHISENDKVLFNDIKDIIGGYLIVNAIYLQDEAEQDNTPALNERIVNMNLYLDTTLLVFALDLVDEKQTQSAMEFINLAKSFGIKLYCFRHNLEEVENILDRCISNYGAIHMREIQTLDYFITKRRQKVLLQVERSAVDKSLRRIGIEIVDIPEYDKYSDVIDEASLAAALEGNLKYNSRLALNNDVDSIAAIYRLRQGNKNGRFETCKHLFVTTNKGLSRYSNEFRIHNNILGYRPVISDVEITSMLWLKTPSEVKNYIEDKIIADAYAAVRPTKPFWDVYNQMLIALENLSKISIDVALDMRMNDVIIEKVMDDTEGDINKLNHMDLDSLIEYQRQLSYEKEVAQNRELIQANVEKDKALEEYKRNFTKEVIEHYCEKYPKYKKILLNLASHHGAIAGIISTIFGIAGYYFTQNCSMAIVIIIGLVGANYFPNMINKTNLTECLFGKLLLKEKEKVNRDIIDIEQYKDVSIEIINGIIDSLFSKYDRKKTP